MQTGQEGLEYVWEKDIMGCAQAELYMNGPER